VSQGAESNTGSDDPAQDVAARRETAQRAGHGKQTMLIHGAPSVMTLIVANGARCSTARHPSSRRQPAVGII
jgi:hypothetical protein